MTRTLTLHNSQPAIVLSLSIVTAAPAGPQVVIMPLANLTPILLSVWFLWQWLESLTITAAHLTARLVFTLDRLALWLTLALILTLAIGWAIQKSLVKNYAKNLAKNSKGQKSGLLGGLSNG